MAGEVEVTAVSTTQLEVRQHVVLTAGTDSFRIALPEAIPAGKIGRARVDIVIVIEPAPGG